MTKVKSHAYLKEINGIKNFMVDDKPFIINGAQCDIWRSTRQNAKTVEFFDAYQKLNATTVGIGVPWASVEKQKDEYDFSFMQWFIDHAEKRNLKLIIHLFDINICGKVHEMTDGEVYPLYTPHYLLDEPETYTRVKFNSDLEYVVGGPPMCPNNPNTLERERKYVSEVAKYLRDTDLNRTVIALQINNEYYYQQWANERPKDPKKIRCVCENCQVKYSEDKYETPEVFMFTSYADYTKVISDEIASIYDIPLYVNSPWWEPFVPPIFLDTCPNIDFVGIDGVFTPFEPNWLSICQDGRNIAFAAETPTESPYTKPNLSVIPYYVIIKQNGIGDLLWECFEPNTVMYDEEASPRYKDALYPIKNAMSPIVRSRGTESFNGWYKISENIEITQEMDIFGNTTALKKPKYVSRSGFLIRQGNDIIDAQDKELEITSNGRVFKLCSETEAGFIIALNDNEYVVATSKAKISVDCKVAKVETGVYNGDAWEKQGDYEFVAASEASTIEITKPAVIKVTL